MRILIILILISCGTSKKSTETYIVEAEEKREVTAEHSLVHEYKRLDSVTIDGDVWKYIDYLLTYSLPDSNGVVHPLNERTITILKDNTKTTIKAEVSKQDSLKSNINEVEQKKDTDIKIVEEKTGGAALGFGNFWRALGSIAGIALVVAILYLIIRYQINKNIKNRIL